MSLLSSTTFKISWKRQFAVYADFDCSLIKSDEPGILQMHEPNSATVYFVSIFKTQQKSDLVICSKRLLSKSVNSPLNELAQECIKNMQNKPDMVLKPGKNKKLENEFCFICSRPFTPNNYKDRAIVTEPANTAVLLTISATSTSSATGTCRYSSAIWRATTET